MAATTMATMALLNARCLSISNTHKTTTKPLSKPISLLSLQNLPNGLNFNSSPSLAGTALAGTIFSTFSPSDAAMAAQQIADIAEGDNRGIALLLPIIPAIAWVLFNILQPALNQINSMRSENAVIVGLGLGGLAAASGLLSAAEASASEIGMIAAEASGRSDNRGQLLLFVVAPAIVWVLYNILQPALNQINRMRSK